MDRMTCESVGLRLIEDPFNKTEGRVFDPLTPGFGPVVLEDDASHIFRLHAVIKDRVFVRDTHF